MGVYDNCEGGFCNKCTCLVNKANLDDCLICRVE